MKYILKYPFRLIWVSIHLLFQFLFFLCAVINYLWDFSNLYDKVDFGEYFEWDFKYKDGYVEVTAYKTMIDYIIDRKKVFNMTNENFADRFMDEL